MKIRGGDDLIVATGCHLTEHGGAKENTKNEN